jgi:hypothetical protein
VSDRVGKLDRGRYIPRHMALPVGTRLDVYEVISCVGEGGMGHEVVSSKASPPTGDSAPGEKAFDKWKALIERDPITDKTNVSAPFQQLLVGVYNHHSLF